MPKVSVIIPVYNVEKYLKQCLDSVINQTLKDIEIICVDDGSTDTCPQILDEYAKQDNRIKVIHKANSGYGHTMNVGMDSATGEYIGVVESDDYTLPEMYETLYNKAKEHDLDIIKSDFYYYWSIYNYSCKSHQSHLDNLYNRVIYGDELDKIWDFAIFTWTGIYKREFLVSNDIRHNETPGASYQDAGFRAQVTAQVKRAMWLDKAFYMYRQDNPTSSMKSKEKMMCVYNEYQFVKKILIEKNLIHQWKCSNVSRLSGMMATFYRIDDRLKKDYLEVLKEDYLTYKNNILYNDVVSSWLNQQIEEMNSILYDSNKFLSDYYEKKQKFMSKLNKNIIVYGTGKIANKIFLRLLNLQLADRILFFAETNPEPNRKFYGLDVRRAEEIVDYKDDICVLVAVSKRTGAYDEVIINLDKLGVTNYSDTDFLWENIKL